MYMYNLIYIYVHIQNDPNYLYVVQIIMFAGLHERKLRMSTAEGGHLEPQGQDIAPQLRWHVDGRNCGSVTDKKDAGPMGKLESIK